MYECVMYVYVCVCVSCFEVPGSDIFQSFDLLFSHRVNKNYQVLEILCVTEEKMKHLSFL